MTITKPKPTTIHDDELCAPPTERVPIMLEITEEDRQKADRYECSRSCLLATALKRMGHINVNAGGGGKSNHAYLDDHEYELPIDTELVHFDSAAHQFNKGPFYTPEVVGKQFILYPI